MAGTLLPPGFRFHPTDVELIMFYLKRKVMGKKFHFKAISELNIYKFSPWDLPDKSCLRSKDLEWYFFCPTERKYASGVRMNRSTENGYWKTTGKDRPVLYNEKVVGMAKTLVFHLGHAPHGQRTDWVIHEYRNVDKQLAEAGIVQDAYVLCKVFHKNGPGPKNGAQYGAPFKEEDWDDDVLDCYETFPSGGVSAAAPAALHLPENPSSSVVTSTSATETTSIWPLAEPGPSSIGPSADVVLPDVLDDDILHLLESFTEDGALPSDQIDNNEKIDNNNHKSNVGTLSCLDGNEVYNGLGDLGSWQTLGDTGFSFPTFQEAGYVPSPMLFPDSFLELNDLEIPLNSSAEDNERVHVPAGNNPSGDSEQLYFGPNHFGADPYFSSSSQLPLLPDGSNNIDGFSTVLQVNGDGTNANQGSSGAYCLAFTQPNESRRIDQNNDTDGFYNF